MEKKRVMSRRGFLGRAALATAPMILPSGVLAQQGRPGANERIVTGHIGLGGRGTRLLRALNQHAAALCDVDGNHLDRAAHEVDRELGLYGDYRRILDRSDIDAVVIASPDHWHGVQTVHACEAGKDVYVEKPASKTVEEGRAMVRAAQRFARVVQVGAQGRSTMDAAAAFGYIRGGHLGQVTRVECWHYENPVGGYAPDSEPPPELDWDMWLGPARWVPYNPERCHFDFRWLLDFGGGQIRDRGAHVLSVVFWCLDLDHTGPVRVTATGEPPHEGLWDCPTAMDVTYEFKDPPLTVVWSQPGTPPEEGKPNFGAVYHGTRDSFILKGGDSNTFAEEKAARYMPPADEERAYGTDGHLENWLECIKSRAKPIIDIEAGHSVATTCILGNIAYRLGRPIEWDPVTERVMGDEQANRMLGNPGRGPWHV